MPALFSSSALSRPLKGKTVTRVQLLACLCVCAFQPKLIPSWRKLERLLEVAGKLWCRGSSEQIVLWKQPNFHFPDWKTDFQENFFMFCSSIQKKTQLQFQAWEFLRAILVLGGGQLAYSQMACVLIAVWLAKPAFTSLLLGSERKSTWQLLGTPRKLSREFWCQFVTDLDSNPSLTLTS